MLGLLLPEFLGLVQYLGALHPQQEEHRDDGKQGRHRVRDDELKINSTMIMRKSQYSSADFFLDSGLKPVAGSLPSLKAVSGQQS